MGSPALGTSGRSAISGLRLVFQPISKPAVNDFPLVASPRKLRRSDLSVSVGKRESNGK